MLKNIPFYATLLNRPLGDGKVSSNAHVLVYGAIEAHAMGPRGCIASNATIAEETGLKAGTVANAISHMAAAKWLTVTIENYQRKGIIPNGTLHLGVKGGSSGSEGGVHLGVNRDYSPKNTEDPHFSSGEIRTSTSSLTKAKENVLASTNRITHHQFRVLPERGITKLLATFTLAEIEQALTALAADDWHQEHLSGLKIDYLLRATTIDKFLAVKPPVKIATPQSPEAIAEAEAQRQETVDMLNEYLGEGK